MKIRPELPSSGLFFCARFDKASLAEADQPLCFYSASFSDALRDASVRVKDGIQTKM